MVRLCRLHPRIMALLAVLFTGMALSDVLQSQQTTTRDDTEGKVWIERLERPARIPGLRIPDVINALKLKPGDVVADIGAGTGAFSIPFAQAVAPTGKVLAQDIWPELLDYMGAKAEQAGVTNLELVLGKGDDPGLPHAGVDVAFFHDVFHNVLDRQGYLELLVDALKPGGRIAIVEQEYDDPVAKKWDVPENRITVEQLDVWMTNIGFERVNSFDLFQGANNPPGAGMPERWFVVYAKR